MMVFLFHKRKPVKNQMLYFFVVITSSLSSLINSVLQLNMENLKFFISLNQLEPSILFLWTSVYLKDCFYDWRIHGNCHKLHSACIFTTSGPIFTNCTYTGCTKVTTNNRDIRLSVTIKSLFANISWTAERIHTIKLTSESTHWTISNDIWYIL